MISKTIQQALNAQVTVEAEAAQIYLAMASWAEVKGYEGIAAFFYAQSEEEREHMLKIIHYINERGGSAKISVLKTPDSAFQQVKNLFEKFLEEERMVSSKINSIVDIAIKEKDHATFNFLQWYVDEQVEEESTAMKLLDELNIIGDDRGGLYSFDKHMLTLSTK